MTSDDLELLWRRIHRLVDKVGTRTGVGFSQSHTYEDGGTHHLHFKGVKPLEEFEDEIRSAFVWAWSMKDYLKQVAVERGKSPGRIEEIVNTVPALQVLADVANGSKHGTLKRSRSGHFAILQRPSLMIPQAAMSSITFGAVEVTTDVSNAAIVEYNATVVSMSGEALGDAKDILQLSIDAWESVGIPYALGA